MKNLHTISAVIELGAGLALLVAPSIVVKLLLGSEISGADIPLGRVAGAALLALGMACWLARREGQCRGARGLVVAMLAYNACAVVILGAAGIQLPAPGIALWPAVMLHALMAAWCAAGIQGRKARLVPH